MLSLARRRGAGLARGVLLAWLWISIGLPLIHSWNHQADHVHGPGGVLRLFQFGHEHHPGVAFGHEHSHYGRPDYEHERDHSHDHGHDEGRGARFDHGQRRHGRSEPDHEREHEHSHDHRRADLDLGPADGHLTGGQGRHPSARHQHPEKGAPFDGSHGDGSAEHAQLGFLLPVLAIAPSLSFQLLETLPQPPRRDELMLELERWVSRSRGPPAAMPLV